MANSEQGNNGAQSIGTLTDRPVDAIDSGQQPGGQDVNAGGVGKGPARRHEGGAKAKADADAEAKADTRGDDAQASGALGEDQRIDDAAHAGAKKGTLQRGGKL